jgi:Domain of unknown function (DUF4349)
MKALLCMLAAALFVSGCGGSDSSSSASRADAPRAAQPGGEAKVARPADARPADARPVRLAPAQAIVYSADLSVRAGDVSDAAARAKQIVAAEGGYVGDENTASGPPSATVTFKIPSARYAAVLDQLASARIGRKLSLRQRSEDVTQEVADVDSRVSSAKATLASFRDLLGKATNVSEVIQIEQEIATREADLESLQARQRSLSRETAFATVTLRIEGAPARHAADRNALAAGWHAFTMFVGGIGTALGWTLPFLALGALFAVPALWIRRRRRPAAPEEAV